MGTGVTDLLDLRQGEGLGAGVSLVVVVEVVEEFCTYGIAGKP